MKKCPLCGKEYEDGAVCPYCNVLLIDMTSGKAVGEDSRSGKARAKKAKTEKPKTEKINTEKANTEKVKTGRQGPIQGNIQIPPAALLGATVIAVIVVICAAAFWFMSRPKTPDTDTIYGENQYNAYSGEDAGLTDSSEGTGQAGSDSVTLNEADFADNEPVETGTQEYRFELPAYWQNLCTAEANGDAIYYYQNRSRVSEAGGYLFSIQKMSSEYYSQDYLWLAETDGMVYALVRPDEPAYDTADPYARLEYERLAEDISYVNNSFRLTQTQEESDYIFEQSSSEYLSRSDLEGLTEQELSYARNEIYARHGRRFQDAGLQSYFDSKEWYSGTIDPEDFTESMLNEYEKANTELILEYEKDRGYR